MKSMILFIILVSSSLLPHATAQPVTIDVSPDVLEAGRPVEFALKGLEGPELLTDTSFDHLTEVWDVESEVGADVSAQRTVASDGLTGVTVTSDAAQQSGTVFLAQRVSLSPGPHELRVAARVEAGEIARYVFLIREEAGLRRDLVFNMTPVPGRQGLAIPFDIPRDVDRVRVFLRFELHPGMAASVHFDSPSLRSLPGLVTWDLDGDGRPDANGTRATTRYAAGDHEIKVRLDGRTIATRTLTVPPAAAHPEFNLRQTDETWYLDGTSTTSPGRVELLANNRFTGGTSGWILDTSEVGGFGTQRSVTENGTTSLQIDLPPSHPSGSVWAYQGIPPQSGSLEFAVDVRDDLGVSEYAIVLRAQGEWGDEDFLIEAPPSIEWQRLSAQWTPRPGATALFVQLRALVGQDVPTTIEFANASLVPASMWNWTVNGKAIEGSGPIVPWPPISATSATVTLAVQDVVGIGGRQTRAVTPPPLFTGEIEGPRLLVENRTTTWDAGHLRDSRADLIKNGRFEHGLWAWTFDASEVGSGESMVGEGLSGKAGGFSFEASKSGTIFLFQDIKIQPTVTYQLALERRDTGVDHYDILLRESGFPQAKSGTGYDSVDTLWTLPATADWTFDARTWKSTRPDSTSLRIFLRVSALEGNNASAWFDDVSLQPVPVIRWNLSGHAGVGRTFSSAARDGPLDVTVKIGDRTAHNSIPVEVLPNDSHVFPSVNGTIRAQWDLPAAKTLVGVRIKTGDRIVDLDGLNGHWVDPDPASIPTGYRLEAYDVRGEAVTLSEGVFVPGQFATLSTVPIQNVSRGQDVRIVATVFDPDVTQLWFVAGGRQVELSQNPNGTWEATWTAPTLRWGDLSGRLTAITADGRQGAVDQQAVVHVAFVAPGRGVGLSVLIVLAAFVATWMPWGVKQWRRGG